MPLAPKAFTVLQHLVTHSGQLITKDELLELAWADVHVGDGALKVCVREIRRALQDDPRTPAYIETAHRRGYRFIAPVAVEAAAPVPPGLTVVPAGPASSLMTVPETHYARSGDVNIAYQVIGSGPRDLVFIMGWVSHLEYFWAEPSFARFLHRLATFSRLILIDKRGTGLSDRVTELPTLEQRMDDVRAVMEQVGSNYAALLGVSEGGPMCALFAATYPEKTRALVMIGTYAKRQSGIRSIRGVRHPRPARRSTSRFATTGAARSASRSARRRWPPIRRFGRGGRPTCGWARAPARRWR